MVNNVTLQNVIKVFEQNTTAVKKTAAAEKAMPITDKLELSMAGVDIQQLNTADIPQVSEQRLDDLRNAIANGTYKYDYDKLAEVLLQQNISES